MDEADGRNWWWKKLGLVLVGRVMLSKANLIICWWMGLHSLPVTCLAWGDLALESIGFMERLMAIFKRTHLPKCTFFVTLQNCCCWCLHPHSEPLLTHACKGDPPSLAGSYGSVFCRVTSSFPWVLVHKRFCLCPPRVESLFQPVLWKSYNQIPLTFKVRVPGDS